MTGLLLLVWGAAGWIAPAQPIWPQFRGPNGQGVAESAHPAIHFGTTSNVVWSTATPPGHSSPCIWGQRIFLTRLKEGILETRAYDRATGERIWRQPAPAEKSEKVQPFNITCMRFRR